MAFPEMITVTGADERTSLDGLVKLATEHPHVEIGLLYTTTPEGRNRYPSLAWLREAAQALPGACAIHICGSGARLALLAGELLDITSRARRVQVNGQLTTDEVMQASALVDVLITQHNPGNEHLVAVPARNHCLLVDSSGGRGLLPDDWSGQPATEKPIGFAGGLGPLNLATELARIAPLARAASWVDMEGRLRVDDWFSLDLAIQAVREFTRASVEFSPAATSRALRGGPR